jgi:acetoacetate decarboxylase
MPGYVKTPEEVERIKKFMMPARFVGEELGISFQTTWEYARETLPPMFEPLGSQEENVCEAYASVGEWQSAYCGDFEGSLVQLLCTYEGIEGSWLLLELMSPELAVTTGREILGECKKMGTGRIWRDGSRQYAVGARKGVDLVQIEADISGSEQGPKDVEAASFEIKMFPHTTSTGLQYPPLLYIWKNSTSYTSYREGTGTLKWGHSKFDPVDTIPIVSVGATYATEYAMSCECDSREIEDPDGVLPQYLWGRGYDDPTWYRITDRWKGVDELNPDPDLEVAPA